MKYLKVTVEGPYDTTTVYERLDPLTEYPEEDLLRMGADLVQNVYSWGHAVVDEDEVPVGDRT